MFSISTTRQESNCDFTHYNYTIFNARSGDKLKKNKQIKAVYLGSAQLDKKIESNAFMPENNGREPMYICPILT